MIKTAMLAASLAALALAALPAIAAAETNNPGDPVLTFKEGDNTAFTVAGVGAATLTGTDGENTSKIECAEVTGSGVFQDEGTKQETGSVKFTFHGCKGAFGVNCTTGAEAAGTIVTTTLPFHLKTVVHKNEAGETVHSPGVLVTSSEVEIHKEGGFVGTHFATFKCGGFITVNVGGPSTRETADGTKHKAGVIGTITLPKENVPSNTATIKFQKDSANPHHQTHQIVTGDEHTYNLWSRIAGGATGTASEEAHGTLTFNDPNVKPELSTTPT